MAEKFESKGEFGMAPHWKVSASSHRGQSALSIPVARKLRSKEPWRARPNPSLKPSPNSKAPGRRCSASSHFLLRRPGTSLSVPA